MSCRVQDGTSYGGDYEAQMDVAKRKADAASNCRFRYAFPSDDFAEVGRFEPPA